MIPDPGLYLLLVLLGGWVAADSTSVGQFMVSRPLVAATLAGWAAGEPAAGALLGLVIEALNLTILPVGAARYPEPGPAAVAGAGVMAGSGATPAVVLTTTVFALSWAWLGGRTVRQLRQVNIRLMSPKGVLAEEPRVLERRHLAAVAADFLRGVALVMFGIPVIAALLLLTSGFWALDERVASVALWAAIAASAAATLRLFGERNVALFATGIVCGCLFLLLA